MRYMPLFHCAAAEGERGDVVLVPSYIKWLSHVRLGTTRVERGSTDGARDRAEKTLVVAVARVALSDDACYGSFHLAAKGGHTQRPSDLLNRGV